MLWFDQWLKRLARGAVLLALAAGLSVGVSDAVFAAAFGRADTDHDGYATYPEAKRVFNTLPEVFFRKFDKNKDGKLTEGDWQALSNFYILINQDD